MYEMNVAEYNTKVMKGYFKKVYPLIASQILARTGVEKGQCIDLGGGPGMLGISYARITLAQVTVYDLLPDCVSAALGNIAEYKLENQMTARQGRAEDIQFESGSIDLVMSRGSIFFWEDQLQGIREVHRVLKPGGWAYIGGGFGSAELLAEVQAQRAKEGDDPQWEEDRKKRFAKNNPQHFKSILEELKIPGAIESSQAGTWIVFQKQ